MFLSRNTRLAAAIAAAVFAVVGHVSAGTTDLATVRILANGSEERVEVALNELQIGESRQLAAASGKPAIVTRTDTGLTVGGDLTLVGDAGGGSERKVRVIRIDKDSNAAIASKGEHKVIVLRAGGTDNATIETLTDDLFGADGAVDEAGISKLVMRLGADDIDGGNAAVGERVIVTRRIVQTEPGQAQ